MAEIYFQSKRAFQSRGIFDSKNPEWSGSCETSWVWTERMLQTDTLRTQAPQSVLVSQNSEKFLWVRVSEHSSTGLFCSTRNPLHNQSMFGCMEWGALVTGRMWKCFVITGCAFVEPGISKLFVHAMKRRESIPTTSAPGCTQFLTHIKLQMRVLTASQVSRK